MKRIHLSLTFLSGLLIAQAPVAFTSTESVSGLATVENTVSQQTETIAIAQPSDAKKSELFPQVLEIPFEESPYPGILERMPFGAPPSASSLNDANTAITDAKTIEEQKKLADSFSWTAINITPEGKTAIGFTDLTPNKPPESYYITVGESANNWKLIQADYATETATIEKDGIQISLKFGNKSPINPTSAGSFPPNTTGMGPSIPAGATPGAGLSRFSHFRSTPVLQPNTPTPVLEKAGATTSPGNNAVLASYRERLNERMKAQESLRQESERKQKEELSKIVTDALRKQQEEAAAAAAAQQEQQNLVVPEGQPVEVNGQ
jgi:hypothetical protein